MILGSSFEADISALSPDTAAFRLGGLLADKVFFRTLFSNSLYNEPPESAVPGDFDGLRWIPGDVGTSAGQSRSKKCSTSSVVRKALSALSRNQPMPKPRV